MTKRLEFIHKPQCYAQKMGHDIGGVRPVMIPDHSGDWVSRHDVEQLTELLRQANKRISELEAREVVIPTIWHHYKSIQVCNIYEQAMDDAGINWRSVDD